MAPEYRQTDERSIARRARSRTLAAVSAGGVVVSRQSGRYETILVGQSRIKRWGLPKGAPAVGESLEQAALREVKEETGIVAEIVAPLGHIEYWFAGQGVRYHKVVHFYLMRAVGGSTTDHDAEHDLVRWFCMEDALGTMSYVNEREVVVRANAMLAEHQI